MSLLPIEHPPAFRELRESDQARHLALRKRGRELHEHMAVLANNVEPPGQPEVLTERAGNTSSMNRVRIEAADRYGAREIGMWFVAEVVEGSSRHKELGPLHTFGISEEGRLLPPDRESLSLEAKEALLTAAETFITKFETNTPE